MSSDAAAYFADGLAVGYLEPEGGTRWDAALAAATLRVEARPFPEEPIVQISISRSGPVAWESTLTARTVSESQVAVSCVPLHRCMQSSLQKCRLYFRCGVPTHACSSSDPRMSSR